MSGSSRAERLAALLQEQGLDQLLVGDLVRPGDSAPDATSDGAGRLDVFVRGVGGGMWQRSFRNGGWSSWLAVGGIMASGGGAASWGPNRLDVVTRGLDGAVWANAWLGSGWLGW